MAEWLVENPHKGHVCSIMGDFHRCPDCQSEVGYAEGSLAQLKWMVEILQTIGHTAGGLIVIDPDWEELQSLLREAGEVDK